MYRQCDMQQGRTVVRGWVPEAKAKEGAAFRITGLEDDWNITRVFGYSLEDLGLQKMTDHFLRK